MGFTNPDKFKTFYWHNDVLIIEVALYMQVTYCRNLILLIIVYKVLS